MTTRHSIEAIEAGSRYIGRKCPTTRTQLSEGDRIIVCHKRDEVFSWAALPDLEGRCPYCNQPIDLKEIIASSNEFPPSKPTSPDKKIQPKHSFEILQAGSRYVGRKCPATRTELGVGDQVVVCHERDGVFSWNALPVLEERCPFCEQQIALRKFLTLLKNRCSRARTRKRRQNQ